MCSGVVFAASCPSGYITVDEPDIFIADSCPVGAISLGNVVSCGVGDSVCWVVEQIRALCDAGVTQIKLSGGLSIPLYSDKSTSPSICVQYNNKICYADLVQGRTSGAINVEYNGVIYHTTD